MTEEQIKQIEKLLSSKCIRKLPNFLYTFENNREKYFCFDVHHQRFTAYRFDEIDNRTIAISLTTTEFRQINKIINDVLCW